MKFIIPTGIAKVSIPDNVDFSLIWPIGTLFHLEGTDIYFRFLRLGGRWDEHYGISTNKGVLSHGNKFEHQSSSNPRITFRHKIDAAKYLLGNFK